MHCPFCGKSDTQVLESRSVEEGGSVRRRRECVNCKKRFTTYERVKGVGLWVIKKDGRREPYDREKVKRGILRAVEKRPVSREMVDDVVEQIDREMLRKEKEEVSSKIIGRSVLRKLKKIDKVAWLRFASVYLEFEDFGDFEKAIGKA
ncbi:transcriptional regulator NrdR [Candidatus Woesebacteria bacterium RIFCSPHIGHO2_01_FULL_38_10]|uniref:Transcriptional repressor NrdR n=1 Tax=Candidatus Woesebacteria bacterium RIFCSPLOWO2_01_FULL_39_10b TaxID=1802517 RepID=A0A1F8B7A8_9BACT|nr:MAG: transcriptional regulator NrdR [Candidatus Woesebacteria bacterium RIFCSPHIGHO2_01_FULL_38_10]OGM59936.1 MAG: transcriptional regulator NrdR [Candidatus Woesebacteria bacterium RIFCSPLOWO2_01_FULL_39_10b]